MSHAPRRLQLGYTQLPDSYPVRQVWCTLTHRPALFQFLQRSHLRAEDLEACREPAMMRPQQLRALCLLAGEPASQALWLGCPLLLLMAKS